MARVTSPIEEERKSYGAVFVLAVGLLVLGAVWAFWDDNISRRPWKMYQWQFEQVEVERAKAELAEAEAHLANDETYQRLKAELAAAERELEQGATAARLAALERDLAAAQVRLEDAEFDLKLKKSELEEAWYHYEHAKHQGEDAAAEQAHLEHLEHQREALEAEVADARAAVTTIQNEMSELRSVVVDLRDQLREAERARDQLARRVDSLLLRGPNDIPFPVDLPKIPKIRQVVLNEFDRNAYDQAIPRVDRCESCHIAINKAGFADDEMEHPLRTHPRRTEILGAHPPETFGCTPCHQGQGVAVNSPAQAHGEVRFWPHPLLRGDKVQASCIGCHASVDLPGAEAIAHGERLFEQLGCHGCHLVEGYGELDRVGPHLGRIAAKVDPAWLVSWIENPHAFRPRTKMPNFLFSREEATAVAAYLMDASAGASAQWLAEHPRPTGVDPDDPDLVAEGGRLVDSLGCRGCHGIEPGDSPAILGENKDIAPNLSRVADKTGVRWLYHWIKDPRGYSPTSRMPSLRLTDDEAAAIASFLGNLRGETPLAAAPDLQSPRLVREGEGLIRKYGCAGCHLIPGMEDESRIGVELTTFGSKPLEELFFGDRTELENDWDTWTYYKLKNPRIYQTERIEQVMPNFNLSDADIRALRIFLTSRQEGEVPEQYRPHRERDQALVAGRRVIEKYNCIGCHQIGDRGGAILARYEENLSFGPPILTGEGAKVQPDWFYAFLKRPVPIRPWLEVRMPTFGLSNEETDAIVDYFLTRARIDSPYVYIDDRAIEPHMIEAGRLLATEDYFSCYSCHQRGEIKPEGPPEDWAPDLAMARERLNPDWIVEWIRDPQALMPGTRMPAFYDFTDPAPDGPDDVLDGDDAKQVEALRDYLLMLGTDTTASADVAAVQADAGTAVN